MPKTTLDVVTAAMRRIGVVAVDEAADPSTYAVATETFEALYAELPDEGFTTLTDANAVPDKAFNAIVQMSAKDIAPLFGVAAPQNDWREGLRRLRRMYMPDDRTDVSDLNSDGTISAEEAQDDLEAQFF
jgi:hypothetical protein